MKDLIRPWVPPRISDARAGSRRLKLDDRVASWEVAREASIGYQDPRILKGVLAATQQVLSGDATHERDGFAFSDAEINWPVATGLLLGVTRAVGSLQVLDYGGSLGSQFFQSRSILSGISQVEWAVVEQTSYVIAGRHGVRVKGLSFLEPDDPLVPWDADVVLFGSVLQYLEDPLGPLVHAADAGAEVIIVDRTPVSNLSSHKAAVQLSPMPFGTSSYAMWIISESSLLGILGNAYSVAATYDTQPGPMHTVAGLPVSWRGFICVRRSESR